MLKRSNGLTSLWKPELRSSLIYGIMPIVRTAALKNPYSDWMRGTTFVNMN